MRKMIMILLVSVVCVYFSACDMVEKQPDISAYLSSFVRMDYDAMFAHTNPVVDIDEEAFAGKYDAIFSGLGVNEIRIDAVSEPDEDGAFTITATYKTQDYGDFTNDFLIKTQMIKEQTVVLWEYSLIFPEMEAGDRVRVKTLKTDRGEIFAQDGTILAQNAYADTVYMDTTKVQNIAEVVNVIGTITSLTDTQVVDMFNKAIEEQTKIVVLGEFFADELTEAQKQDILSVFGMGIDDKMYTPIRDYPLGEYTSHMIGYTGYYNEEELPEGYTISDKAGLSGLEAAYETQLRGVDGKIIYIEDKWGKTVRTLYHVPCKQGQDLRLTIKPYLQKNAYNAMRSFLRQGQKGVVVVMDASTGFVEAMASYPAYDNNLFTFPLSESTWEDLNAPENNKPLVSRATGGRYPPGSVFKPFTAAVALEAGVITPETVFNGEIIDNKWTPDEEGWHFPAITRIDDSGSPLKLHNGMTQSDNIYFAFAALRLGEDRLFEYLRRIGMEEAVPFDIPVMKANLVNNVATRKLVADMGYGQGELLITPIQLAAMYTAFAGGTGDMLSPILVQKLCQTDGLEYNTVSESTPAVWIEDAVSGNSLDVLTPILKDVIEDGTGYPVEMSDVSIAGKTGTAEIDKTREISWFVGYWMDQDYKRLVIVMVDGAAEEGTVKFDIARAMLTPQTDEDTSDEPDAS